jgi:acyl-homoserine lactone acylase PvdQ
MYEHLRITAGRLTALTIWRALPFVFCALLAACTTQRSVAELTSAFTEPFRYDVEIRRTMFGIPHIKANDFGSLGYGLGYAYAEDNVCLMADAVLTVRGERSRFFGADGTTSVGFQPVKNLDSDVFFKFYVALLTSSPVAYTFLAGGVYDGGDRVSHLCESRICRGPGRAAGLPQ